MKTLYIYRRSIADENFKVKPSRGYTVILVCIPEQHL